MEPAACHEVAPDAVVSTPAGPCDPVTAATAGACRLLGTAAQWQPLTSWAGESGLSAPCPTCVGGGASWWAPDGQVSCCQRSTLVIAMTL